MPPHPLQQVVEFVGTALARNPDSAIACSALCEEALRRGSGDNMTAMIVQLQVYPWPSVLFTPEPNTEGL